MFFVPFDIRKQDFLQKFIVTLRLGATVVVFFETSALKEVRILCLLSPQ